MDFYRAMLTAKDPSTLDAASVATTLESAKNIPLFMGGGETFSCGKSFFAGEPSVCTGAAFLASYDGRHLQARGRVQRVAAAERHLSPGDGMLIAQRNRGSGE